MLKGVNLTLLIGPAVPIPAPQTVMESLTSIQVNSSNERTGFQLTFAVSKESPLLKIMLPAGYFDPMTTRVIVIVTMGGLPNVLMDGIVTRQEFSPNNEPGKSTLTITGEDLSVLMNIIEVFRSFPALPDVGQVSTILAPYRSLGIVPIVIPSIMPFVRSPSEGIDHQCASTDLDYIRMLAQKCGYVFYVEPGPFPGSSIAYFGPDLRIPIPQPALSINMDVHTNVESLSFSLDGLAKKILVFGVFDPVLKRIPTPLPLPNISIVHPPLGVRPTPPAKIEYANKTSNMATLTSVEATRQVLGMLLKSTDAISCNGALDVLRYGRILRSRQLVGVRGAGLTYDGLYYVNSVTHNIKRGEYKQNFTLSRDGLISNTPRLPV
jgi:hypothetical protein